MKKIKSPLTAFLKFKFAWTRSFTLVKLNLYRTVQICPSRNRVGREVPSYLFESASRMWFYLILIPRVYIRHRMAGNEVSNTNKRLLDAVVVVDTGRDRRPRAVPGCKGNVQICCRRGFGASVQCVRDYCASATYTRNRCDFGCTISITAETGNLAPQSRHIFI